jgi:hypothetical protein
MIHMNSKWGERRGPGGTLEGMIGAQMTLIMTLFSLNDGTHTPSRGRLRRLWSRAQRGLHIPRDGGNGSRVGQMAEVQVNYGLLSSLRILSTLKSYYSPSISTSLTIEIEEAKAGSLDPNLKLDVA